MRCQNVREILSEVDHLELAPPTVAAHLLQCLSCRGYLDEMAKLQALLRNQKRVAAPPDFDERLRQRLNQRTAHRSFRLLFPTPALIGAAAVVIILLAIAGVQRFVLEESGKAKLGESAAVTDQPQPSAINSPSKPGEARPDEQELPVPVAQPGKDRLSVSGTKAQLVPGSSNRFLSPPVPGAVVLINERYVTVPTYILGAQPILADEIGKQPAVRVVDRNVF